MTSDQALNEIQGHSRANRISITRHARKRMNERNVTKEDIAHALKNAIRCERYDNEWRVFGHDIDGEDLTCGVAIENGVVVVTVF